MLKTIFEDFLNAGLDDRSTIITPPTSNTQAGPSTLDSETMKHIVRSKKVYCPIKCV